MLWIFLLGFFLGLVFFLGFCCVWVIIKRRRMRKLLYQHLKLNFDAIKLKIKGENDNV